MREGNPNRELDTRVENYFIFTSDHANDFLAKALDVEGIHLENNASREAVGNFLEKEGIDSLEITKTSRGWGVKAESNLLKEMIDVERTSPAEARAYLKLINEELGNATSAIFSLISSIKVAQREYGDVSMMGIEGKLGMTLDDVKDSLSELGKRSKALESLREVLIANKKFVSERLSNLNYTPEEMEDWDLLEDQEEKKWLFAYLDTHDRLKKIGSGIANQLSELLALLTKLGVREESALDVINAESGNAIIQMLKNMLSE